MNERQLLRKARKLEEAALAEIYDLYSDGLFRYAVRFLNEHNLAEECVAETYSRFLKALHAGKGPRDYVRAYLYRIAHNWIMDYFRRHRPADMPLDDELPIVGYEDVPATLDQNRERRRVREALMALTADQRQVIVLKFYEGWRNREIAAALGKPIGSIKSLQHRALASLQRQLEHVIIN